MPPTHDPPTPRRTRRFPMADEGWRRHAHPWSVHTRIATVPALILAVWSRDWIGWWSLLPITACLVWLALNPFVFPRIDHPRAWASKGIYGERIQIHQRHRIPPHHRTALRLIMPIGMTGMATTIAGLVLLHPWLTALGATLLILGQLWRIDRLVWLYTDLHPTPHTQ